MSASLGAYTNVSYAHIKNFKNLNEIAKAKGEIINNITNGGTMVINMDDKYCKYFKKKSKERGLKILTYSKNNQRADIVFLNKKIQEKIFN